MAYLKALVHAILVILGIWALGQVFYRRAPVDIRADQSHAVEADNTAHHTAAIGLCFIVRTYWAHGANDGSSPLKAMLQSFIRSNHKKWEALILVMDLKVRTTKNFVGCNFTVNCNRITLRLLSHVSVFR